MRTSFSSGFCTWMVGFMFLFAPFALQNAQAQSSSNFVLVKLPRGIELQIPKSWELLGADLNRVLETSTEATMDLSGIGLPRGSRTNLLTATSIPRSTYAVVRVTSTIPPSVAPSQLLSISADDIRDLQTEMRQILEKGLSFEGIKLIKFFGSRIERISGHPAIVTEYRQTDPNGPLFVQINQIFTNSQEIGIGLSYRESEALLWKSVVGKIKKSIVVRRWP